MPTPSVVKWFRVYCGALSLVYLGCVVGGVFISLYAEELGQSEDAPRWLMVAYGSALVFLGLVLAAVFGAGVVLQPRPWVWIYGIVLIAIGFSSPCCIPASVPLLFFWLKPETRVYFGRSPE
jgi:hypothetical protein